MGSKQTSLPPDTPVQSDTVGVVRVLTVFSKMQVKLYAVTKIKMSKSELSVHVIKYCNIG